MTLREQLRRLLARRGQLVGINRRNVELVYAHNPRRHYPLADDKLLAKGRLAAAGIAVPETLLTCDGLFAIPAVIDRLAAEDRFVVKPAAGSGGDGILVIGERLAAGRWRCAGGDELAADRLGRHLAAIVLGACSGELADRAFVERRIEPHEMFAALWGDGLCDVRIITLRGRPLMAMVRVPTAQSRGRANLHQGGLGLAVDLASGRSFRAVHRGQVVSRHPESGSALLGLQLPAWGELVELARRTAAAVPLGYLGCDLVVNRERGPLVLEINVRPGLEIQNVHGRGLGAVLEATS